MRLRIDTDDDRVVELSMTPEMCERVMSEWEQENPGKQAFPDMGADEFARRMMIEIEASARVLP